MKLFWVWNIYDFETFLLELKIEKKYIYKNNCKYKNNTKSKMYIFTVLDKSRYMFIEITSKENINIFLYNLKKIVSELLENKNIVNKNFELGHNSVESCNINHVIDIIDFRNYDFINIKELQNIIEKNNINLLFKSKI